MPLSRGELPGPTVAFVLKGYPRLSEAFIAQEIYALENRGLDILIVSLRHPTDDRQHPVHDEIRAPIVYLPEYPKHERARVVAAWRKIRKRPGYARAKAQWKSDYRREPSLPRLNAFPQAMVLAAEAPATLCQLHAHFLHTPASVTWYAALILGLPWTCSAHARDIWTAPNWDKRQKLAALEWLVTCTGHGCSHLQDLCDIPRKVALVYHGLDFARFPVPEQRHADRDGTDAGDPVILLSVGRAVQKKGYHFLLEALAELPGGLHWRFRHIGYGPILAELQRQALELGIADRVDWLGAMSQDQVIEYYRQADLFVLANCVAEDGDMDGLPNVMMEAQSQKLACISTKLSGIPELIVDGETGLLVPPENPAALSAAVSRLCREPQLRTRLSINGFERLHSLFSHQDGIDLLADKFGLSPEPRHNSA